jgi:hypothetical protein
MKKLLKRKIVESRKIAVESAVTCSEISMMLFWTIGGQGKWDQQDEMTHPDNIQAAHRTVWPSVRTASRCSSFNLSNQLLPDFVFSDNDCTRSEADVKKMEIAEVLDLNS